MTYDMFNENSERNTCEDRENGNGTQEEKYRQNSFLYTRKNL